MIYRSSEGERLVGERYRVLLESWPVPSEQRQVATREGDTFVVSSGPEDAPPVLLLHGSAGTTLDWLNDVASWSNRFRVHAVDLIGEPGLSAHSRPEIGTDAYALWLDDVVRALGIDQVTIVGVSIGGWFGLDYAIRRPGQVDRLALLTPSGIGRQKWLVMVPALLLMPLGRWGIRKTMELVAGPLPPAAPSAYGRFALLLHEHFKARRVKLPIFADEDLAKLDLLVIVGARDRMLDSRETHRRLPDVTVVLPEVGHILPPQTQRVLDFLERDADQRR